MTYTHLGRSRLVVSRLCLGTMNFGPASDAGQSLRLMSQALEAGINFFDTGDIYGWKLGEGVTEKLVGRWLKEQPSRREQIVLATKVYGPMGVGPNDRGLSAYHIRQACEGSLRRLNTEHIDVYIMHHMDRGEITASEQSSFGEPGWTMDRRTRRGSYWDEIWQALDVLVQQGKVLYVGSSNFPGWHIAQSCETAVQRNLLGPICEQSLYNLTTRTVELEVIPACREYGLGFLPYSPLAGGLLAGALDQPRSTGRYKEIEDRVQKLKSQVESYERLCKRIGEIPDRVALAWLLYQPDVTALVIGPRTEEQLESSLQALDLSLDEETRRQLDSIWPGLGGEAPEVYAW